MAATGPAVYPGTFDPPTLGHLDVIGRAIKVFDEIVVAVTDNPGKAPLLCADERQALLREATADLAGVSVETYQGLTVDYARSRGARVLVRGIRTMSDFDDESHLAGTNRAMSGLETVFVMAGPRFSFISSTLIKEVARLGGDVSEMVPPCVGAALERRFGRPAG